MNEVEVNRYKTGSQALYLHLERKVKRVSQCIGKELSIRSFHGSEPFPKVATLPFLASWCILTPLASTALRSILVSAL